ncbi:MAG: lysylphosphatidylglycerol synthase transmembrane domain-containing protein [Acidimicrobiales bacterium]|nr:flippase-like domain-containing protein [Acidimicrobiales bacterium]
MSSTLTTEPAQRSSRAGWMLLLRALVSVGMLAFLLLNVPRDDLGAMWSGWDTRDLEWLAGAAGLTAGAITLAAMRWKRVLATLGVQPSLYRLVVLNLAGQFVSNFLPTTVGGDVLRVRRLGRRMGDVPRCFASVVIERLTGWVVLPLLTLFGLAINPGLARLGASSRTAIAIAAITFVVLLLVVWVAEHPRVGRRLEGTGNVKVTLTGLHLGLGEFRSQPRAVVDLLAVGIVYQLALIGATAMAAEAVGIDVSPTAWLAFAPAVLIAQVLPLSIGGLGLREGALVLFLGPLGVSQADAILLGLLLYAINLAVSLLGAPAFAYGWIRGYDKVDADAEHQR